MDLATILTRKNVRVTLKPKEGALLRKQWEKHFAAHLSSAEKARIHLTGQGGYLWHLFSFKKREYLQDEEAIREFDAQVKDTCFVFYQHQDHALVLEQAALFTHDDLEKELDIYVVDESLSWTFVKTHETGWCGPYFCRA